VLQPFIDALIPFMPGYLELPASYVGLLKSASHKYIRRVPKSGGGYRYFYHVGHGGGVANEDHFVPGASFRFDGGHYHIKREDGGKLTIEHDETKERKTVSKAELRSMLTAHHEPAIKAHREKIAGMLAEARANKASPKQIAKLEARAKAAGVPSSGVSAGPEDHHGRIARLGVKPASEKRTEILASAHGLGVDDATFKKLAESTRINRAEEITLPSHRHETLSRGSGWATNSDIGVTLRSRESTKGAGYRVPPGKWSVGASDGYQRKGATDWTVEHVTVGPHTWTVAN
jgi:hypothetical protein